MTDNNTTLPSKIMACIYGVVCIALAFSAESMGGGVLQASLTIFGVVGGPLLAVFTLGMCTTKANQRGVLLGFAMGLAFSFWIGFGGPKPMTPSLPLRSDGCSNLAQVSNSTFVAEALSVILNSTTTAPPAAAPTEYFWLFRLSYLWFSVLGFLITLTAGFLLSWLLESLHWADNSQIYIDPEHKQIDFELFVPPLSRKLAANSIETNEELNKLNYSETNGNDYRIKALRAQ